MSFSLSIRVSFFVEGVGGMPRRCAATMSSYQNKKKIGQTAAQSSAYEIFAQNWPNIPNLIVFNPFVFAFQIWNATSYRPLLPIFTFPAALRVVNRLCPPENLLSVYHWFAKSSKLSQIRSTLGQRKIEERRLIQEYVDRPTPRNSLFEQRGKIRKKITFRTFPQQVLVENLEIRSTLVSLHLVSVSGRQKLFSDFRLTHFLAHN